MRGAIFDLDGTLADTSADLLGAANEVLVPHGLPPLDPQGDRNVAGRGALAMIRRSLTIAGRNPHGEAEKPVIAAIYPKFLVAYEARIADETRLYDGAEACLTVLADAGWRLGVCTNKPERLALILLERLGVLGRFGALLGADTLPVRKPDPEHFRETARRIGADPARSIMLGDTKTDLDTARNASVPVVLTHFGFAAEPLETLGADATVTHFDEIAPVLERLSPA